MTALSGAPEVKVVNAVALPSPSELLKQKPSDNDNSRGNSYKRLSFPLKIDETHASSSRFPSKSTDELNNSDDPELTPTPKPLGDLKLHARALRDMSAEGIFEWALKKFGDQVVLTTTFGPTSATMLHIASKIAPKIPIIWIDTGYHTRETYRHAEIMTQALHLNVKVYHPLLTRARIEALYGNLQETDPKQYAMIHKVEPMRRALSELGAKAVLIGLRKSQVGGLQISSHLVEDGQRIQILPLLQWTENEISNYDIKHNLPKYPLASPVLASVAQDPPYDGTSRMNALGCIRSSTDEKICRGQSAVLRSTSLENISSLMSKHIPAGIGIEIYSKLTCRFCLAAKKALNTKNTPFVEYVVGADVSKSALETRIGRKISCVPQIFLNGEHIGGYNDLCSKLGVEPKLFFGPWGRRS